jgi:hypothetical protein
MNEQIPSWKNAKGTRLPLPKKGMLEDGGLNIYYGGKEINYDKEYVLYAIQKYLASLQMHMSKEEYLSVCSEAYDYEGIDA